MALDASSGKTHLLHTVHPSLLGPAPTLRRVRLWSAPPDGHPLSLVHTHRHDQLRISPFRYEAFPALAWFLSLPDDVLLEHCSTSPDCEHDGFCQSVRESFRFMRDVPVETVFVDDQGIQYNWNGNGNANQNWCKV